MAGFVNTYAPNKRTVQYSASSTAWQVIGKDGTAATSIAGLSVAPYPGLDPGMFLQTLTLRSEGAAGADGSAFWVQFNTAAQPADTTKGELISGSGQTIVIGGPLWNIWIKKTVAGDIVELNGAY